MRFRSMTAHNPRNGSIKWEPEADAIVKAWKIGEKPAEIAGRIFDAGLTARTAEAVRHRARALGVRNAVLHAGVCPICGTEFTCTRRGSARPKQFCGSLECRREYARRYNDQRKRHYAKAINADHGIDLVDALAARDRGDHSLLEAILGKPTSAASRPNRRRRSIFDVCRSDRTRL